MTNWQTSKCPTLMDLQNDASHNSLWHSTTLLITPRPCGIATTLNMGKNHVPAPSYKRPQGNLFEQNNSPGIHGNFKGYDS